MTSVIVIGGGPAGTEAALEAARLGGEVTLVSAGPIGGRAGWFSLLPSKLLLEAAHRVPRGERLGAEGVAAVKAEIDRAARAHSKHWAERLDAAGVTRLTGRARFVSPQEIELSREGTDPTTLAFDHAIVATGSGAVFPPALKPDGARVLAPKLIGKLDDIPGRVAVIGAGATGAEFAYAFAAAGAEVRWVVDEFGVLPGYDRAAATALARALEARGVTPVEGARVERLDRGGDALTVQLTDGRAFDVDLAFVAVGRRADLSGLGFDAAGVRLDAAGLPELDALGGTSSAKITVVGDAAPGPMVANKAQAQGRRAAQLAMGRPPADEGGDALVLAVYSRPQVAQVGLSAEAARAAGFTVTTRRASAGDLMRTHLVGADADEGWLELIIDEGGSHRILGGVAVGPRAADQLAPVALALRARLSVEALASVFVAYPTDTELAFIAARQG